MFELEAPQLDAISADRFELVITYIVVYLLRPIQGIDGKFSSTQSHSTLFRSLKRISIKGMKDFTQKNLLSIRNKGVIVIC